MSYVLKTANDVSSATILIIAEPVDHAALWLHAALTKISKKKVCLVTPSQLSYAPIAIHRLSTDASSISFNLANGDAIYGHQLSGVINRVLFMPQAHLLRAEPNDRAYAQGELYAFALGWLASLPCPILNAPTPEGLSGASHSEIAARHFAILSGLRCQPQTLTVADRSVDPDTEAATECHVIFDGQVIGNIISSQDQASLRQFAYQWGGRMVQIHTYVRQGHRFFATATSLVDFKRAGTALVLSIARALEA